MSGRCKFNVDLVYGLAALDQRPGPRPSGREARKPVENLIRYIAEQMEPDAPDIQENVSDADKPSNNSNRAVAEVEDQTAAETNVTTRLRKIAA